MAEELIGKQMRRWELDQRLKARFEQDECVSGMPTPVVTISRQWGSGGTNIAKVVAKELDFRLYDKEIIDRMAELSGVNPRHIEYHEDGEGGVVNDLVLQLLDGKRPTAAGYLRVLVRALKHIGREGNAVIVGRAANFVLPLAFNVRIVAPEDLRIARLAELHDTDTRSARRMVINSDRNRYRFIRANFGADWNDPMFYDLVINTEQFSIEHAAELIVHGFLSRRKGLQGHCQDSA